MNRYCFLAILALKEDIPLAGIVAKEHPLDLLKLMSAKERFMKT